MPLRVVFMGTPEFAVPSLRILLDRGEDVAAVITQPDRPRGRGKRLAPPPVKVLAESRGVRVLQPERVRRPPFPETLRAFAPELIVVVAFGQILPKAILDIPPLGCVNVHASLLPRWRGAAPIAWAVDAGDAETGVTTMRMDEGMDTGDMLLKSRTPILPSATAEELTPRLAEMGARLLGETLDALRAGTLRPEPQDASRATLAPLLKKEDGYLDFARTAPEIVRRIHAVTPWPGAAARLAGEPVKLFRAEAAEGSGAPGETIAVAKDSFLVAAGSGAVRILEVQAPGKRRMSAREFLASGRPRVGDRFERME